MPGTTAPLGGTSLTGHHDTVLESARLCPAFKHHNLDRVFVSWIMPGVRAALAPEEDQAGPAVKTSEVTCNLL